MADTILSPVKRAKKRDSLSVRLLGFVIGVILLVELIIFVPSAVTFRDNWIDERLQAAHIAALALEASPSQSVSDELANDLLRNAEVLRVAINSEESRELLISPKTPPRGTMLDVSRTDESYFSKLRHTVRLFFPRPEIIMEIGAEQDRSHDHGDGSPATDMERVVIEVLVPEAPLRKALMEFSWRILGLSLIISIVAGVLVYLVLDLLVVRPMRTVTEAILRFRNDPGASQTEHKPSTRKDEIGLAQNALTDMSKAVSDAFRQRERLAELGEAVAKINHDLRNSLGAAQLVSEGLARSEDPRVQRAAPRLERALERAINLAQDTLQYGKVQQPKADLQDMLLCETVEEAAHEALVPFPGIKLINDIQHGTMYKFDPDHLHRIVANLIRNAAQATHKANPDNGEISVSWNGRQLRIADNGPGLPEDMLDDLFKPFSGTTSKGGTGLGLAIASELSRSMGGDLELGRTGPDGTEFVLTLP